MSENAVGAGNQQETSINIGGSSETTRQAPFSKEEAIAYLQGALHDATFNKGKRFRFSQKGIEWLEILKEAFSLLGFNSWIYREGKTRDVYVLETLAHFLDFRFDPLQLKAEGEQRAYIRGFFDAEGGIPHSASASFYIQLVQNDRNKLQKIKTILNRMDIRTGIIHNPSKKLYPEYWRMFVLQSGQRKFVQKIGTIHPRKIKLLQERMMI